MSEIVGLADYTPEIQACIERLRDRMEHTRVDYRLDDVLVVRDGDVTFVLANPVLGEEVMGDGETIPMRNVTMVYYDSPPEVWPSNWLRIRLPRMRVFRPDLCLKIVDGKVMDCAVDDLEAVIVRDWERHVEGLLCQLGLS